MYSRTVARFIVAINLAFASAEHSFDLKNITKVYSYGDLSPIADVLQRGAEWYNKSGTIVVSKIPLTGHEQEYYKNNRWQTINKLKELERVLRDGKLCQKSGIDMASMKVLSRPREAVYIEHRAVRQNNWCTPLQYWRGLPMKLNATSAIEGTMLYSRTSELVCKNDAGEIKLRAPPARQILVPISALGKLVEDFASKLGVTMQTTRAGGSLVISVSAQRFQLVPPNTESLLKGVDMPRDLSICVYSDNDNLQKNMKRMAIYMDKFIGSIDKQLHTDVKFDWRLAFSKASSEARTASIGSPSCFPGEATVELLDGRKQMMKDLKVGDVVKTGVNEFSPVFLFTHHAGKQISEFIKLTVKSGESIFLTRGHMIYANGDMKIASEVAVGDILWLGTGKTSAVVCRSIQTKKGLFNPQTTGDIVVNDIITSTYTFHVVPDLAHLLLAPFRVLSKPYLTLVSDGIPYTIRHSWIPKSTRNLYLRISLAIGYAFTGSQVG